MSESEKKKQETGNHIQKSLFDSRTVLIFGEIDMDLARKVSAELLALDTHSQDPIKVVVNSPGGHVESGDTIHDMLKFVKSPIKMIGTGWVASAGALIYLGASKENRFCLPNTRFLLHQPSGGMMGQASDLEIQAREIIKMKERLNKIIAQETGQPMKEVEKHTERDYWLTAEEAIKYGIVKKVVQKITEI